MTSRRCRARLLSSAFAGGGAVGNEKLGAKEGLREERLSLVHRYMTEGSASAPMGPQPSASATRGSATTQAVGVRGRVDVNAARAADLEPLALAKTQPVEPGSTVEAAAPLRELEEAPASEDLSPAQPAASQLLHQTRLPIYEWAHADANGERQREADWPHELVRLREERDWAQEKRT